MSEAKSGETFSTLRRFGRTGTPSISTTLLLRDSVCVPKASRIEPATISILSFCGLEKATSMTKKLISRPMRSAKVTNQPPP